MRLSTDTTQLSACDGTENITFYFGVENNVVSEFKKNYYNPTAFVERLTNDIESGVSTGFIWVAKKNQFHLGYPNWDLKNRLLGVLLHEIGHIYGIEDIDGPHFNAHPRSGAARTFWNISWLKSKSCII